jgi:phosphoglycolate phosphatase-like HAD superfamily hydrolase
MTIRRSIACLFVAIAVCVSVHAQTADPLPSWNDGSVKESIVSFVTAVTRSDNPRFVQPAERIATFDNDGTLWVEQPMYTQLQFALARVRAMAPSHPEWKTQLPFSAVIKGDDKAFEATGEKGLAQVVFATHTGMTPDVFKNEVDEWIARARHPRFNRLYTELAYQPMLELLGYLRANGFKTYIVTGGTVEFVRAWSERVYGIPPEQVVGTTFVTRYGVPNGQPTLTREPDVELVDDGPGKPVAIQQFIGRRPIFTFGNSDGDQQMLEWTAGRPGARFVALVHHTDAEREYAYDRTSRVGRLDKALDEAARGNWVVVDMKRDWRRVFSFDPEN